MGGEGECVEEGRGLGDGGRNDPNTVFTYEQEKKYFKNNGTKRERAKFEGMSQFWL
jgi:hypothetical protein